MTGSPVYFHNHLPHVVSVRGPDVHRRRWRYRHRPGVLSPSINSRLRIVEVGESIRNISAVGHLFPTVQPDGLHLLEHDLRGAKILTRELHGEKAGGKAGEQGADCRSD